MEEQAILILNGIGGTPGVIRTPDPLLRRQVLYPAELRAHSAGDGRAAASQRACQCQKPSKHTLTYVHCAMRLSRCQSRISPSTEKPEAEHHPRSRTSAPVPPRPAASAPHVFRQLSNAGRCQLPTQNCPAKAATQSGKGLFCILLNTALLLWGLWYSRQESGGDESPCQSWSRLKRTWLPP